MALVVPAIVLLVPLLFLSTVRFRAFPIFVQTRVGRNGVPIRVPKVRSLPSDWNPQLGKHDLADVSLLRTSHFLRVAHLDELPQIFCILRGTMTWVGPRPMIPEVLALLPAEARVRRAGIAPGLTGLWQISSTGPLPLHQSPWLDVLYVEHATATVDARVIAQTLMSLVGTTPPSPARLNSWLRRSGMAHEPTHKKPVRVAVAHDYFTQRGGAERVALLLGRELAEGTVNTALFRPAGTYPDAEELDIVELIPRGLSLLRRNHRMGVLLYPLVFWRTNIDADVVICSSSGFAHGVRTSGRKIVYCHTPARWLYADRTAYLAPWPRPVAAAIRAMSPLLRTWDRMAMASAEVVLANSTATHQRIKEIYGIDAKVIAPPPGLAAGSTQPVEDLEPGYLLSVGRLLVYKNVDVVIDAMRYRPSDQLVVVGEGPERAHLESAAPANCRFVGEVTDEQLRWLYANCRALVSSAHEDFGLTPLEAAGFGRPSAVLRARGFLDTVVDGETGVFFDRPDPVAIDQAIERLDASDWHDHRLRYEAAKFEAKSFVDRIRCAVEHAIR